MRNQKGITLIALVITIIVLLILAGVSIAMLTGQNGILTQAGNAQDQTRDSQIKEAIAMAVSTINADRLDDTNTSLNAYDSVTYANIATAINADYGAGTAKESEEDDGIIYTYNGKDYKAAFTISNNGIANNQITISADS